MNRPPVPARHTPAEPDTEPRKRHRGRAAELAERLLLPALSSVRGTAVAGRPVPEVGTALRVPGSHRRRFGLRTGLLRLPARSTVPGDAVAGGPALEGGVAPGTGRPGADHGTAPRHPTPRSGGAGTWVEPLGLPVLVAVAGAALMGARAGGPAPGDGVASRTARPRPGRAGAWAELLRLPAWFTVRGDTVASGPVSEKGGLWRDPRRRSGWAGVWGGPVGLSALVAVTGAALVGAGAEGPGGGAASRTARPRPGRAGAWAELLRLPALFTVPGDALAGAAAVGARPGPRTLLAIGSSLCLYEAGMALNDWADRAEDAVERPHRPIPSGRVEPAAALAAACGLTGAGLVLAARAGRPALAVAAPLAATVWSYDLALKHTPAGPVAMAAARALDLLLGAAATGGGTRAALPSAALLGSHTLAVTAVSRRETTGGSALAPLAALATTGLLTRLVTRRRTRLPAGRRAAAAPGLPGSSPAAEPSTTGALATALGAAYAATAARPYVHAALNPSPPLTQRAVGGGIRATIPLQAALAARSGSAVTSLLTAALVPAGRAFARRAAMRKVSIT